MRVLHVGVGNFGAGGVLTYVEQVVAGQRAIGMDPVLSELWPGPFRISPAEHVLQSLEEFRRLHDRLAPDVVHFHSPLPAYSGVPAASVLTAHEHSAHCPAGSRYLEKDRKECKRPFRVLSCVLCHYLQRSNSRHPRSIAHRMNVTKKAIEFPGRWVAPSNYARDRLLERGINQGRVHLVLNPGPARGEPVVRDPKASGEFLFVGRLVPNKGCDVAIRAVARSPRSRLRILGDGPEAARLLDLCERLGVTSRVAFESWVPRAGVGQRMDQSLAVVIPSLWPEPFGLVALEAFSRSRGVIASRTGGLVDIVEEGKSGRFVAPGSVDELAAAMDFMLDNPDIPDRMGRVGETMLATRFSLETHLSGLNEVYAAAMADAKTH